MNNIESSNRLPSSNNSQRIEGNDLFYIVNEIKLKNNLPNSPYYIHGRFSKKLARHCGYKDILEFFNELLKAQTQCAAYSWQERLFGFAILDAIRPPELKSILKEHSKERSGRSSKRSRSRRDSLLYEIAIRCGYFQSLSNKDTLQTELVVEINEFKNEVDKLLALITRQQIKDLESSGKIIDIDNEFDPVSTEEKQKLKKAIQEIEIPTADIDNATMERVIVSAIVKRRKRSPKFKKSVLLAHGIRCACCEINLEALIEAAHIRPVAADGNDETTNGIPLCPTHHTAFDASLFTFDPEDQSIILANGITYDDIGITKKRIDLKLSRKSLEYRMSIFNPDKASTSLA